MGGGRNRDKDRSCALLLIFGIVGDARNLLHIVVVLDADPPERLFFAVGGGLACVIPGLGHGLFADGADWSGSGCSGRLGDGSPVDEPSVLLAFVTLGGWAGVFATQRG